MEGEPELIAALLLSQTESQRLCGNIKCKEASAADRMALVAKPVLSLKFVIISLGLFSSTSYGTLGIPESSSEAKSTDQLL